ncbi:MAG: hypothetical protein IJ753_07725 [Bacteroidales bacterium]|nr:hypothetical protein [Bacteroidales bacterium]
MCKFVEKQTGSIAEKENHRIVDLQNGEVVCTTSMFKDMEEMDQLEMFKQQLRRKPAVDAVVKDEDENMVEEPVAGRGKENTVVEDSEDDGAGEEQVGKSKRRGSKQKEKAGRTTCLRVSPGTLLKLRVISIWLESEGEGKRPTMMSIMEEAVEYLLEQRYPRAKKLLK